MSEAPAPRTKEGLLEKLSGELADLVERVAPSIVALTGEGDDFEASGSGFFVDEAGHVVTNFHVVDGLAQPMEVGLHGGDRRKASLVGSDPLSDLALLKLADPPGPNLRLREDPPRLGELCVGLGSPFGMYPESVAFGVVSGLARTIEQDGRRPIEHAIQTDVAINPGNSGGPLVDVRGEVIGVNQSHDTRGTGIGFAVPAEIARWVIAELKDYGKIERASLGVSVVKRTVELDGKHFSGLAVVRDGAPDDAGLRGDDVIVQLAGQPIDDPGDLYRVLTRKLIDTPTPVQVIREGKLTDLTITPTRLADLS